MALVISSSPEHGLEEKMKEAWEQNKDGVGALYKTVSGATKLYRWVKTEYFQRIEEPYLRLLIHFRLSTGGFGTHPFAVEGGAVGWYLAHNGSVMEKITPIQEYGEIDTLKAVRVFARTYNATKTLKENTLTFMKELQENYTGMFNFLLYNPFSDEWIAISDGSLEYLQEKNKLIIASDFRFDNQMNARSRFLRSGYAMVGQGLQVQETFKWGDRRSRIIIYSPANKNNVNNFFGYCDTCEGK
jgi:predicted glutamine amidotransferase